MKKIDVEEVRAALPVRARDAHKGDFGHVLVAGGSAGFGGAPALATLAALRTGSGLVTAAVSLKSLGILGSETCMTQSIILAERAAFWETISPSVPSPP